MEQDKPKNLLILGYTFAICAVLVGTVIFVDQYLRADVRHEFEKKVLQAPDVEYQSLRATEDGKLRKYTWIDQGKGIVRIPRERARELVLKEWASRPGGVVAPAAPLPGQAPAAPAVPPSIIDGTAPTEAPIGTGREPGAVTPSPDKDPPGTAQPKLPAGETPKKGEKQP